jgi:adenylate cyclase, class 2
MPVEIEAKMAVESFDAVRAKLRETGATPAGAHFEVNTFFDTDARGLLARGEGLRLRMNRDAATGREDYVVTYKGPRRPGPLKSREEIEFDVAPGAAASELFERLGYRRTMSFEKRRETWELGGCKVELDEVPILGRFVEVEGPDAPTVLSVRDRLGLSERPIVKDSYIALLTRHLTEKGEMRTEVTFAGA